MTPPSPIVYPDKAVSGRKHVRPPVVAPWSQVSLSIFVVIAAVLTVGLHPRILSRAGAATQSTAAQRTPAQSAPAPTVPTQTAAVQPATSQTLAVQTEIAQTTNAQTTSGQTADGNATSSLNSVVPVAYTPAIERISCASPSVIAARPMAWRMANLIVVGLKSSELPRAMRTVRTYELGGVLIRGTPKRTDAPALRALRDSRIEMPTFVAVDEEGGRVQHLKRAIGPLPSAKVMAETKTPEQVRILAKKHAMAMRELGFNVDLGPVVDLYKGNGNGIGDRAFSPSPEVVTAYGLAFAQGLLEGGIFPVLKHWPGGGSADGDPHNKGTITRDFEDLKTADLVPFDRIGATLGVGIMVGHQQVPGLGGLPSSVSERAVNQTLRAENRFNGLVMTDSLSMWSIKFHWSAPKAAELALRAGNDVLLFDDEPGVEQIVQGLTDAGNSDRVLAARAVEANLRILVAKGIPLCTGVTVSLPKLSPATTATATTPATTTAATTTAAAVPTELQVHTVT